MGGIRQITLSVQLVAGFLFATLFAGHVMGMLDTAPALRNFVTIALGVLLVCLFANFGLALGQVIQAKIPPKSHLQPVNAAAGGVLGAITAILFAWLVGPMLSHSPILPVANQMRTSRILVGLDSAWPTRPVSITEVANLLQPFRLPKIFIGAEPTLYFPEQQASSPSLASIVQAASKSVVKVSGRACNATSLGSGFFVKPDLVITNAHVIAGITQPIVDSQGQPHTTKVVWFDPNLDVALLKLSAPAGSPLHLKTAILPRGANGAVIGFPKGGTLNSSEIVVLDAFDAQGFDIYDQKQTTRNIYALNAHIVPGNSGGPIIDKEGAAIGLVIGHSLENADVGYALTLDQIVASIDMAAAQDLPAVGTGACSAS